MATVWCPNCAALSINGIPCHETGCPNSDQAWKFRSKGLIGKYCIPKGEDPAAWMHKDYRRPANLEQAAKAYARPSKIL
jgi:hypothetical protein